MTTTKAFWRLGMVHALSGAISVIMLALSAHYFPKIIEINKVASITTAAQIQLFHCILIVSLSMTNEKVSSITMLRSLRLISIGSHIFSVSIYLLSLREILGAPFLKFLGPVTPLGGLILITGWILLAVSFNKMKTT